MSNLIIVTSEPSTLLIPAPQDTEVETTFYQALIASTGYAHTFEFNGRVELVSPDVFRTSFFLEPPLEGEPIVWHLLDSKELPKNPVHCVKAFDPRSDVWVLQTCADMNRAWGIQQQFQQARFIKIEVT